MVWVESGEALRSDGVVSAQRRGAVAVKAACNTRGGNCPGRFPGTAVEGTKPLLVAVAVTAAACVRVGHGQCPTRMAIDAYGTATRTFVARELADGSGEVGRHLAGGHDGPFERLPFEDRGRHGSDGGGRW